MITRKDAMRFKISGPMVLKVENLMSEAVLKSDCPFNLEVV